MSTKTTPARVPVIPMEYCPDQEMLGQIPAQVAEGFEVTRVPNSAEAIAEARRRGQVVVRAGDRNPLNPDEPLIANEELFTVTPEGYLCYRGDLLVVWSTAYANAVRAQAAAKMAHDLRNVQVRRMPLDM